MYDVIRSEKAVKWMSSMALGVFLLAIASGSLPAVQQEPAFLGVSVRAIDHADKKAMKISFGVQIVEVVKDSPADRAGLIAEDVIQKLDGKDILAPKDLTEAVKAREPGEKVNLLVNRKGSRKDFAVQLSSWNAAVKSDPPGKWDKWKGLHMKAQPWLGIQLLAMSPELAAYFKVKPEQGVLVLEVNADSPALQGGMLAGDVIHELDKERVRRPGDVRRILGQLQCDQEVPVKVIRHGKSMTLNIKVGKRKWPGNMRFHLFKGKDDSEDFEVFSIPEGLEELKSWFPRRRDAMKGHILQKKLPQEIETRLLRKHRHAVI